MAGTKISDLPSASALTGAELVPVVQSDVTKKTTVSDILTSAGAGTVTSVDVSGGTTGLTATGGPITTAGTITLGGTLDVDNGGTGATTAANARTNLDVPSRSGSGASGTWSIDVTGNAGTVTNGVYTSGSYANPSWITSLAGSKITGNISGNAAGLTSTLSTGTGGTGQTTYTNGQLLIGNASGSLSKATLTAGSNVTITNGDGTITIAATSGGSGTVTSVNASGGTTGLTFSGGPITSSGTLTMAGTLDADNGGTGQTSYTNGQLLIGNSAGGLTKATLTAGSGISITNGNGSITLTAAGSGLGDVTGPASATDNAVALFNGTTGKIIKNSADLTYTASTFWANLGVGGTSTTAKLNVGGTLGAAGTLGAVKSYAYTNEGEVVYNSGIGNVDDAAGFRNKLSLQASGSITNYSHFAAYQNSIPFGSSVTNQYGFYVDSSLASASLNIGYYSNVSSAASNWNFYSAGSASNLFVGDTLFGAVGPSLVAKVNVNGSLAILGSTSGYTKFQAPATGSNVIYTLPSADGTSGQVLKTDGAGALSWTNVGGTGTVTSVNVSGGTTGLTTSGGPVTGAGTITIAGTLGTANGGTNSTATPTAGGVAYGNGTALLYSSVGTAGQYLQSAGAGTPVWSSISSGVGSTAYAGAFQDTTTQTIASTTTAYPITLNTDDYVNGVTRGSPTSRVVFANAGVYNIQWSGQFQNTSTSLQDVRVWIRINGVDVSGSTGYISVPNSHGGTDGHIVVGWNYVLNLSAGDYIEFVWTATSTTVTLQAYSAGTSPTSPTAASVIVTANQLTQIGIGYYGLSSASSVLIGTGSKTFTTNLNATNTAFTVGSRVRVAYTTTPTNFMEGVITAFSGTTMTVSVDVVGGSGTYAAWSFTSVGSAGVTSISGGTTGLTPSTATTGAVTLAGTVATTNGGTGLTSFTSGGAVYATSTSALTTGTLPVASGGTGLASGTSGGVLYYSAAGTLASSSALAANALVVGGGAGIAPSTVTTGTGVVTALGVNTGSAGAFVVNGGALGTPSSGTLTNATGLPLSTGVTGTLGIANGGTGVTTSTGSGSVVLSTSPTLVTPILGTPTSGNLSNCTADGTNNVGYRNIPQSGSDKTTSYTLATTDVGKFIGVGTSGSIVVPNSTFAAGDVVSIFNNTTGNVTITTNPTSSYIAGANTTKSSVTLATRGVATILFISGTVCVISGNVS